MMSEGSNDIPIQDNRQNLRYAEEIVVYMHKKFYPGIFKWTPLAGDMFGLLMQIDNMVTGLRRDRRKEQK